MNVSRETNKPIKLNRLFTKFVYFGRLLRGNFATKLNKKNMQNSLLEVFMILLKSENFSYKENKDTAEVVVSLFPSGNGGYHRVKAVYDCIPRDLLSYVMINNNVLEVHVFSCL